jgi:GAF domain-containing protein
MLLRERYDTPTNPLTRRERLKAVGALLPCSDTTPAALQQFVDRVAAAVDAPCAALSLILNDTGMLAATHGVDGWLAEAGGMPAQWAPCASVVRQNHPLLINDTHDDPAHTASPLVMITGVRSYAGVPLHFQSQPVGSLCVLASAPGRFTDADLRTLQAMAPQAVRLLHEAAHS